MGQAATPDICNLQSCSHVQVTPDGDHAYLHAKGMINIRHHDTKDCIVAVLQTLKRSGVSELECGREVKLSALGIEKKPEQGPIDHVCDFYLQSDVTDELPIIYDVSIRQPKYTGPEASETKVALYAADRGHTEKMKHYLEKYVIDEDRVKPLIFESTGGWDMRTVETLRRIVASIAKGSEKLMNRLWTNLQFNIAVTLARSQGKLLLRLDRRMKEALAGNTGTLHLNSSALPPTDLGTS
jgi:hypothetical protein